MTADAKKKLGLPATAIAIQVIWTNKGFQKGDVIVAVEGQRSGMTTSDFLALCVQQKKPGDKIALTVLRAGKEHKMQVEARAAPIARVSASAPRSRTPAGRGPRLRPPMRPRGLTTPLNCPARAGKR